MGAAAEDRLPEQPLRAPSGALCLFVHLARLQSLLLLSRQVLQVSAHLRIVVFIDPCLPWYRNAHRPFSARDELVRVFCWSSLKMLLAGAGVRSLTCLEFTMAGHPTEPCTGLLNASLP